MKNSVNDVLKYVFEIFQCDIIDVFSHQDSVSDPSFLFLDFPADLRLTECMAMRESRHVCAHDRINLV